MNTQKNITTHYSRLGKKEQSLLKKLSENNLSRQLGLEDDSLNIALNLANTHILNGLPLRAFEIYSGLVLLNPLNIDVQIGLANCATELGEHDLAIQAAAAVIVTAPADPRGYLLSGKNCLMIGSYKEAREDLEDALNLSASDTSSQGAEIVREATSLISRLDMLQANG